MTEILNKSEDQIAKDKEAVARMAGAKSAMESALRRIETLEKCLRDVREQSAVLGKAFGETIHLNVYSYSRGDYRVTKARDLFDGIDNTIKAAL